MRIDLIGSLCIVIFVYTFYTCLIYQFNKRHINKLITSIALYVFNIIAVIIPLLVLHYTINIKLVLYNAAGDVLKEWIWYYIFYFVILRPWLNYKHRKAVKQEKMKVEK